MSEKPRSLVTGGAGFLGSNFVLAERLLGHSKVVNLDLLTYAGNPKKLGSFGMEDSRYLSPLPRGVH